MKSIDCSVNYDNDGCYIYTIKKYIIIWRFFLLLIITISYLFMIFYYPSFAIEKLQRGGTDAAFVILSFFYIFRALIYYPSQVRDCFDSFNCKLIIDKDGVKYKQWRGNIELKWEDIRHVKIESSSLIFYDNANITIGSIPKIHCFYNSNEIERSINLYKDKPCPTLDVG